MTNLCPMLLQTVLLQTMLLSRAVAQKQAAQKQAAQAVAQAVAQPLRCRQGPLAAAGDEVFLVALLPEALRLDPQFEVEVAAASVGLGYDGLRSRSRVSTRYHRQI